MLKVNSSDVQTPDFGEMEGGGGIQLWPKDDFIRMHVNANF